MIQNNNVDLGHVRSQPSMRRRYILGWIIVTFISLIDAFWLGLSGHSVNWASILVTCRGAAMLICLAAILRALNGVSRYRLVTAKLHYGRVSDTAAWCALLVCFVSATCVLSYLCVSINAPLIETRLIAFDRAFGFDWVAFYKWVQAHPYVKKAFQFSYASGQWQLVALPLILSLFGRREAVSEFFFLLLIGSIYLLLISTPFPATSAFIHFNVDDPSATATVSDFALLRNGSLQMIDIATAQGLVSIPSFHTALAVLFTYSLRRLRLLFCIAIPLNVVMILSTPTQGGHYLADVIAGLVLSVLTVQTLNRITHRATVGSTAAATFSARTIAQAASESPL
ncbi:phosphatase PAP2 family protein [Caballeronia udeis]|nr:phosphatase PAP2 family protein [Caballeronia udeis]